MGWWARFRGRELPERTRGPSGPEPGETRDGVKQGVWIEEGDLEHSLLEAIYRDGVRQGPFRQWHSNGFMTERGVFVDGERSGEVERFFSNGRRGAASAYRAGKLHGISRGWDKDGVLAYEREYRDGAMWAGVYDLKSSDADHFIWRKAYKDGHPIGAWEENDFRGDPTLRARYDDDGRLDGAWTSYHEHGKPKLDGAYANGERIGVWRARAPDGTVVAEIDYGGDATWRADGAAIEPTDDVDLARWIELASAWTRMGVVEGVYWRAVERAIDAWPDGDRARACGWIAARIAERDRPPWCVAYGGRDSWIAHLLRSDDDPRAALVGGIETDHDHWHAEHMARVAARAGQLRVLSLYEVDLDVPADVMFPDGVAWPKLEKLSILESGPPGTIVRTLAGAAWAQALRELALDGEGEVSDADSAALLASPHLASLRTLHLSGFGRIASAIASAPMFASLEELALHFPGDVLAVLDALAARDTPLLRRLVIRGEGAVTRNTIIGLVAKTRHPKLAELKLQYLDVPDGIAEELAGRWPSVRVSF